MQELNIYFKVFGLSEDNNGKPNYTGMKLNLGKAKEGVKYSDIQKKLLSAPDWKRQLLKFCNLESLGIKEKDIELITPEEYARDYDNEEE